MSGRRIKGRMEEFEKLCRQRRVPCTRPRRLILQTILEMNSHPTADEVYASSPVRAAGISRATVYRAVENLEKLGAIFRIGRTGSAVRYDGRVERHHHLLCLGCGSVLDIADPRLDAVDAPDTSSFGFAVKSIHIQVNGYCRRCLKAQREKRTQP
jgi:Fe2+ or Zn2+ uptake regulation protein